MNELCFLVVSCTTRLLQRCVKWCSDVQSYFAWLLSRHLQGMGKLHLCSITSVMYLQFQWFCFNLLYLLLD